MLESKIKDSADFQELGSQVAIFSTACFPDIVVGSVDSVWVADKIQSRIGELQ